MRYSKAKPKFWIPAHDRPLVQVGKALDYRREAGTKQQRSQASIGLHQVAVKSWESYCELVNSGITPEVARAVLPQSTYTTLWLTGNLRSWLAFLDNRMDKHAQHETQEVGVKVAEIFAQHYPITYEAWSENNARTTQK